jgi:glycosyltransferase involved in cell wall biosynthesis
LLGDIASLREVWRDAAWYVPPDDEEQLEAALRALIADEELRASYARRAERRAARYTPVRMAAAYAAAYAQVAAATRAGIAA